MLATLNNLPLAPCSAPHDTMPAEPTSTSLPGEAALVYFWLYARPTAEAVTASNCRLGAFWRGVFWAGGRQWPVSEVECWAAL